MGIRIIDLTTQTDVAGADYVVNSDVTDGVVKKSTWTSLIVSLKLVITDAAQTLTNKTLTSPKINENVALTKTSTELNSMITTSSTDTLTNKTLTNPKINENVALTKTSTQLNATITASSTDDLTNKTLKTGCVIDSTATVTEVLKKVYPVGSIYINAAVSTNPATLLGFGTWTAFASGRAMVGLDAGQTEFNTLEETGGAKTHTLDVTEMPSHSHAPGNVYNSSNMDATTGTENGLRLNATANQNMAIASTGGGLAHNNLQPYIVVYMWKRTV